MKVAFFYAAYESVGIEYLAASLAREGHECRVIFDPALCADNTPFTSPALARRFDRREACVDAFERFGADVACFSVVSDDWAWARQMAAAVKRRRDVPTIFGNIHPTSVPERVLADPAVDWVVCGEGEPALVEVIARLDAGRSLDDVANLAFRRGGEVVRNPVRAPVADLDTLPFPDKEIFYGEARSLDHGYLALTARGCPFNCTFCNVNVVKGLYPVDYLRRRSVDDVLAELTAAQQRYRFDHVRFVDEMFTFNKAWLREFSTKYAAQMDVPFYVSVHPNTIDEETASLLAAARCGGVFMGIQTTDYEINKRILNRRTKTESIVGSIERLGRHRIGCSVDLIFGIPGLTETELRANLDAFHEATPDFVRVFWLSYYPKTEIIQTAISHGLLTQEDVDRIEASDSPHGILKGGDTRKRALDKYANFLFAYPILPRALRGWLLRHERYALFGRIPVPLVTFLLTGPILSVRRLRHYTYADRWRRRYREFVPRIVAAKLAERWPALAFLERWTEWSAKPAPASGVAPRVVRAAA